MLRARDVAKRDENLGKAELELKRLGRGTANEGTLKRRSASGKDELAFVTEGG